MKKIKKRYNIIYAFLVMILLNGCELAGLDLQKDHKHQTNMLDPHINMTAWEFLNTPRPDTLFNVMLRGIKYAGLGAEYAKPGRTFLALTNLALYRLNTNGTVNTASYFGKFRVPNLDANGNPILDAKGVPTTRTATKWSDYPVEQVRQLFLYHIVEGTFGYNNLKPDNTIAQSLLPDQTKGKVYLLVRNNNDSKITINDYPGSTKVILVRTGDIRPTNGVVHVLDTFAEY